MVPTLVKLCSVFTHVNNLGSMESDVTQLHTLGSLGCVWSLMGSDSMLSKLQEGLTALILAIKQGYTQIVWELVDHAKADVNIQEQVRILVISTVCFISAHKLACG